MRKPWFWLSILAMMQMSRVTAISAQSPAEADHSIIIEVGGAGEWPVKGERPNFGATLAAEVTPIERWLEVEAGITGLGTNGQREMSADLVLKKPFRLSSHVELMAGLGPEVSWALTRESHARTLATECALDLMVWPTRNLGVYLEPTYNLTSLGSPRGRSFGLTGGMIVGLPWLHQ